EAVWDQPNPNKGKSNKMSPAEKDEAKRRAKAAGRPYPNLVDNMAAMKESEIEQDTSDVKVVIDKSGKERKVRAHKRVFNVESLSFVEFSMMDEEEKKTLNKPFLTPDGPKKRSVYVKDPSTGNVKKVNFGDPNMTIKKNDPERRKSFRARHHCEDPGPKTKARYWSCRAW
ncbi:hypothetical protein EB118_20665, partial [bacterium]|nr:hypothetical protein [bacterium]